MKKLIALTTALVLILAFSLVGCNSIESENIQDINSKASSTSFVE